MTPGTETLADGRYTLVEVLGEGGMASVWRAHDARLDCERAVKLLQPRLASVAELRARFETEARTMARLSHPNIVAVHDVGEDRGRIFIVMELLEGGTLAGWQVEHGVMPPRLVVDVILGVLGAVSAAHEAGVVHRDLKPQNVLLSRRGTPKVADFGIAHVTQEMGGSTPTRTGQVLGTLGFMPPEQRLGSRGLDGRADIYAVGAMLYSLATGLPPPDLFASNEDEAMLTPVPPSLLPVVVRATRYKPETRYGTAEEMIAELDAVRRTLPEPPADTPPLVAPGLARGPATTGSGRSTSGAGRSSAGRTGSTPATPPPASQTFVERPGGGTIVALEPDAPPPPVPPTTPSPLASRTPMIAVGAAAVALLGVGGLGAAWALMRSPAPEPRVEVEQVPSPEAVPVVTVAPVASPSPAPVAVATPSPEPASAPVAASPASAPSAKTAPSAPAEVADAAPVPAPTPAPEPVVAEAPPPEPVAAPPPVEAKAASAPVEAAPVAACLQTGSWQGKMDGRPFTLVVSSVSGGAVKAQGRTMVGQTVRTISLAGGCSGDRVDLAEADGMKFSGIVAGNTISGTVVVGGKTSSWSVQRK